MDKKRKKNNLSEVDLSDSGCTHFSCFDVYRCQHAKLTVHVPEPKVWVNEKGKIIAGETGFLLGNIYYILLQAKRSPRGLRSSLSW